MNGNFWNCSELPTVCRVAMGPFEKSACHSERSGVRAANGTQSRKRSKPVHLLPKQTGNLTTNPKAMLRGRLGDSSTPLRSGRNDTRFSILTQCRAAGRLVFIADEFQPVENRALGTKPGLEVRLPLLLRLEQSRAARRLRGKHLRGVAFQRGVCHRLDF